MFTGIVEALGRVDRVLPGRDGLVLWVDLGKMDCNSIKIGDSVAVNGACLTVTELERELGRFDVSSETMSKCLVEQWSAGTMVNLEQALTLARPLGGHLVSGHVDGISELIDLRVSADSTWMQFAVDRSLGRYVAIKGSVAIDGVSLTSNHVEDHGEISRFDLTLVPHTLAMTTLGTLKVGSRVHLEVDMLARYLDRIKQSDQAASHGN